MLPNAHDENLAALKDIRSIMDRSTRFVSLSGMSGIWAGITGLAGSVIAYSWLRDSATINNAISDGPLKPMAMHLLLLGVAVLVVAITGAFYFTYRKAKHNSQTMWSKASQQLLTQSVFPLLAGGIFCIALLYNNSGRLVAPATLIFYGLALISGGRHTLSEVRYLGMLEVALGSVNLFFPGHGLYFWAAGFGLLHIIYGAMMWSKYDNRPNT